MKISVNVSYVIVQIVMVLTMVTCISVVLKAVDVQIALIPKLLIGAIMIVILYSMIEVK